MKRKLISLTYYLVRMIDGDQMMMTKEELARLIDEGASLSSSDDKKLMVEEQENKQVKGEVICHSEIPVWRNIWEGLL